MESQLNCIAEQEPWKNLSTKYFGIHSYLKEAISKSIMFDIQPDLLLEDDKIDEVVKYLLNNHRKDLLAAMKYVSSLQHILLLMHLISHIPSYRVFMINCHGYYLKKFLNMRQLLE